jgi:hypothetical protein
MAKKGSKTQPPRRMDRERRRAHTLQVVFLALTVVLVLSMLLSLVK